MLDEKAERDHCTRSWSAIDKDKSSSVIAWLMAERAEAYARGKHEADEGLQADTNTVLDLAAAKGEVLALREGAMRPAFARAEEQLAWFLGREQYVRALTGAVEDAGVFRDEAQDEWRQLVNWEAENPKP